MSTRTSQSDVLDYRACFARNIRVLSVSPAFVPMVAEMALAMVLETLLQRCRVIFVLAIPSKENRALLDRPRLELIQPGAVLALMSRTHVVDFDALTELLYAGRFNAAIHVFPKEPVPADHPIRNAPGAVLAAHRAGTVREDMWELGRIAVNDLEAMLEGLPPREMQPADPDIVFRLR